MMIRTDHAELVEIIKDLTRTHPDCGHTNADPNSCYICAGKVIDKADREGNLIIVKEQP